MMIKSINRNNVTKMFPTSKHSLGMFTKAGFAEEGVRKNRVQVGRELVNEVLMGKVL